MMKYLIVFVIMLGFVLSVIFTGSTISNAQSNSTGSTIYLNNVSTSEIRFHGNLSSAQPFNFENVNMEGNVTPGYLAIFTESMNLSGTIQPIEGPVNFTGIMKNGTHPDGKVVGKTQVSSVNAHDFEITNSDNLVIGRNVTLTFENGTSIDIYNPSFGSSAPGCKKCH
jgi:hypothetical protein